MSAVATTTLRLGTRGSRLALVQTTLVADRLRAAGVAVETVTIETDGDRRAPDTPWGEGAFVTAIEQALLDGHIDVAVHSAKDVPTDEDRRLRIAAFLPRERPEDVLVLPEGRAASSLRDIPAGARVGTDSPRRTAFLRAARPDLQVHPLHGNVDTRLRRLDEGETDVLVLAAAGLRRLGLDRRITMILDPELVPPAPGQGALAVQVRADSAASAVVDSLDDPPTRRAVAAERALLAASGGGCRAPLGAIATVEGDILRLRAGVATPDGAVVAHLDTSMADEVAPVLEGLAQQAAAAAAAAGRPRVVVTGAARSAAATVLALVDRGYAPVVVPSIAVTSAIAGRDAANAVMDQLEDAAWIVLTSAASVAVLRRAADETGRSLPALPGRWAVVGAATERALREAGVDVAYRPTRPTGAALAADLPVAPGDLVVLSRGDLADDVVPEALTTRGARVTSLVVYRTEEGPATSIPAAAGVLTAGQPPIAVVATSPSGVRGWLALAETVGATSLARSVGVVAIGPTTAAAVRGAGLPLIAEAADPAPGAVADALLTALPPPGRTEDTP